MFLRASSPSLLSDHMPFTANTAGTSLLSWNILCQMTFNQEWQDFNNGFGASDEHDAHYQHRMDHIAHQIKETVNQHHIPIICLQECPDNDLLRRTFHRQLENYDARYFNNENEHYYLMTLFDNYRYMINRILTDEISNVPATDGLKGRILPLVLIDMHTYQTILVVNVHANFTKEILADLLNIYHCAQQLKINHVTFIGDFNRDLVTHSDERSKHDIADAVSSNQLPSLHVRSVNASSFMTKFDSGTNKKTVVIETRDGIISTSPTTVTCETAINTPNTGMLFTKPISPDLKNFPFNLSLTFTNNQNPITNEPERIHRT
jgi:endonuclease/exonuclease/phosphatase family metal-dependent hydrolase